MAGRLMKSQNKIISGVCGGIAENMHWDKTWVRIIYAFLTLITGIIPGVILYIVMMFVMPDQGVRGD